MISLPGLHVFSVVHRLLPLVEVTTQAVGITAADTLDAFLAEFRAKYSDAAGKGAAAQEGRS